MPTSFEAFVTRLREIERLGYVPSVASGRTDRNAARTLATRLDDCRVLAGRTPPALETTLRGLPGAGALGETGSGPVRVEILPRLRDSTGPHTLFVAAPPPDRRPLWGAPLVRAFGTEGETGRPRLDVTVRADEPTEGFVLDVDDALVTVAHEDRGTCAEFPLDHLRGRFEAVASPLVAVAVDAKRVGGRDRFRYAEARSLAGFDPDGFRRLLADGAVAVGVHATLADDGHVHTRGPSWELLDWSRIDEAFARRTVLVEGGE